MKNKIIQVVGIPGTGKTYLLDNYYKMFKPKDFTIVEFGQEIHKNMKDDNHNLDYYVNKLIDEIISQRQPAIISSHLLHKTKESYNCDFKYDRKAKAIAYIHIITDPHQIYKQRLSDNDIKQKIREGGTIDSIAEHQELSLVKTIEIIKELSSDLLLIHNNPKNLQINLKTMDTFFNHYLRKL